MKTKIRIAIIGVQEARLQWVYGVAISNYPLAAGAQSFRKGVLSDLHMDSLYRFDVALLLTTLGKDESGGCEAHGICRGGRSHSCCEENIASLSIMNRWCARIFAVRLDPEGLSSF